MKRIIVALGLAAFSATGCTITAEDLADTIGDHAGKLNIDKETALAYTEAAMKQAGMSASAVTSGVPSKPAASPRLSSLEKSSVSAADCVAYTEYLCSDTGTCQYTEDYTACGNDYKGTITRKFEGTYDSYKITVTFDEYAEKPTTDVLHYAFDGSSSLDGTLGFESANLTMHNDGDAATYLGGRLIHMKTSATMVFKVDANGLTINGTQSGTITETAQAGTITVTDLNFPPDCAEGPAKGTVKTLIDNVETVTTITACGKGTVVVGGGEAEPVDAATLTKTFAPSIGGEEGAGFDGITQGTSGDSLLSGDWMYSDMSTTKFLSLYSGPDGTTYISMNENIDNTQDGSFWENGDQYMYAWGSFTFDAAEVTATWDDKEWWTVNIDTGDYIDDVRSCGMYLSTTCTPEKFAYTLVGSDQLTFNGVTYTRQVYTDPGVPAQPPVSPALK